jgi:hypothetical protein
MTTPKSEPKKLTQEERERSIDDFCAEVNRILGRQPPTQEEIDRAVAESNTLD